MSAVSWLKTEWQMASAATAIAREPHRARVALFSGECAIIRAYVIPLLEGDGYGHWTRGEVSPKCMPQERWKEFRNRLIAMCLFFLQLRRGPV
jgi:hypothetical protein